jgi:signal transduction histidine kinase
VRVFDKHSVGYVSLLAGSLLAAVMGSYWFGGPLERAVYDEIFRLYRPRPWQAESALLVVDERTLDAIPGGIGGIRRPLAEGLRLVARAQPKAIAVDLIFANPSDAGTDAQLAAAFAGCRNLALSSELVGDGWEDPLPQFARFAAALGHVHVAPDADAVVRGIALARRNANGIDRRWALALEAFRLSRHADIVEPYGADELDVGGTVIPTVGAARMMRVRFPPPGQTRVKISLRDLLQRPALAAQFAGKVVFAGVTAQTEHDRLFSPYSEGIPTSGTEINADAFETIAQGLFIRDVPPGWVALFAALLVAAAVLAFRFLPGWRAYAAAALVIAAASATPYFAFMHQYAFPFTTSASAAWLGSITAAAYYHLVVRRSLRRSEAERTRYQQAMHFVTHEMRTPLSAIQGSSELISRFALTEEKRKQVALLINSESKRLARMVEIFLNVERLSAGQMELKHEAISIADMVEVCMGRTRPLAERKHIGLALDPISPGMHVTGDRELMEYACYNLLTNAVKYSPQHTEVRVCAWLDVSRGTPWACVAVKDQGIGMDQKEVKQIFRKFYRTRTAEESGEAGTGIGLSIVQQIVEQHGGHIDVVSQLGAGSCFTLVLPATVAAAALDTSAARARGASGERH